MKKMKKLVVVLVISLIFVFGLSGLSSAESWCNPEEGPNEDGVRVCKSVEPNKIDICEMPEEIKVKLNVTWPPGECLPVPIDVVFAIDSSGSMKDSDPGVVKREEAVNKFIDEYLDSVKDRAVIVSWDDDIDFTCPCKEDKKWGSCKPPKFAILTNDFEAVKKCMEEVDDEGYTNFDVALNASIKLLDDNLPPPRELPTNRIIVFLTDGCTDVYHHSTAVEAANKGYKIYPVGLGREICKEKLLDMNTTTGGKYKYAETADDLIPVFREIAEEVSCVPVISEIKVIDVLHNYLKVKDDTFTIYPLDNPRKPDLTPNPDGTTTMKWGVWNLTAGEWKMSFIATFELSLPVDVVDGSKTPKETSEVKYSYKGTPKPSIPFPEGELLIACSPKQTPSPVTPIPSPTPPGFEAIFAIAGVLAVAYLTWRRKK